MDDEDTDRDDVFCFPCGHKAHIDIPVFFYAHVATDNLGTRVEIGPQLLNLELNESIACGPTEMVRIPANHYCIVQNPVEKDGDESGQTRLKTGSEEIRLEQLPFPLYPGEVLKRPVGPICHLGSNVALRLRALQNFVSSRTTFLIDDEWIFCGPGIYVPRDEVAIEEIVLARTVESKLALKLRAKKAIQDATGNFRLPGDEWMVVGESLYYPSHVDVIAVVNVNIPEKVG